MRDLATGQVRWRQPWTPHFRWTGDGRLAGLFPTPDARIVFWDGATGEVCAVASVPGAQHLFMTDATAGPLLLVQGHRINFSMDRWPPWAVRFVDRLLGQGSRPPWECRLLDATTGQTVAKYPMKEYGWAESGLAPDGRTVMTVSRDNAIQLWDVPPRKPWLWFAAAVVGQLAVVTLLRRIAQRRRG